MKQVDKRKLLEAFKTPKKRSEMNWLEERQKLKRGRFFCFEGVDGSGKTTMAAEFAKFLRGKSGPLSVVETKEPGGGSMGLRKLLLDPKVENTPESSLFMFLADRSIHLRKVFRCLLNGVDVVCDRNILSTIVFQSENFSIEALIRPILMASSVPSHGLLVPDLTVIVEAQIGTLQNRLLMRESGAEGSNYDTADVLKIRERTLAYRDAEHTFCKEVLKFSNGKIKLDLNTTIFDNSAEMNSPEMLELFENISWFGIDTPLSWV